MSKPVTDLLSLANFLPMLAQMRDGIFVFNVRGKLIYSNDVAAKSLGYETSTALLEARGNAVNDAAFPFQLTYPSGEPLTAEEYPHNHALRGKAFGEQPFCIRGHHRGDLVVAVRALPLCDDGGKVKFAVMLTRSLSEAPREPPPPEPSTDPIRQLADVIPTIIVNLDEHLCHLYANPAYLKTFDLESNDLRGKHLQEVVGPVIYHQLSEPLQQGLQGKAVRFCLTMRDARHQLIHKYVTIIPHPHQRQTRGLYLVLSDISAHEYTSELLQTETNFFRHSLEAASVGTWDWNFVSKEMMWSLPQEKLFGLKPGSFDGRPETYLALVDPRDREMLNGAIAEAMQPQQNFAAQFRVTLPDGTVRWLNQRGQVLRDEQGTALRMVGVTFDITQQQEAQAKLMQQVKRDRLIAQISQDVSHYQDLDTVLQRVVEAVRSHLEVDRLAVIDLRDKLSGKVTYEDHVPEVDSILTWELRHPYATKRVFLDKFRLGHPVAVSNIHEQPFSDTELTFLSFFDIAADLTVPLLEDKQLWGLLSAQSRKPRDWQPDERRLLQTLGTLLSTAIQRDRLHRRLTKANRELQRFAYLDGLTQVANRRRFEQFLNQEWRRLMREQSSLGLIMADIDHFKAYNDIYGHQAGDECLRRVAGTLRSAIHRPADMVARYGGEEFAIVLPNTDLEGAETVAENIRSLVHKQKIIHQGSSVSQFVTMSLGVAVMAPHPLKAPDDLIKLSDAALYKAKTTGRDRVVCHSINDELST